MEAQLIQLLNDLGISPQLLADELFLNFSRIEAEDVLFPLFFRFGLDPSLLPQGKGLQDIASLFDQLIHLVAAAALRRESGATLLIGEGRS